MSFNRSWNQSCTVELVRIKHYKDKGCNISDILSFDWQQTFQLYCSDIYKLPCQHVQVKSAGFLSCETPGYWLLTICSIFSLWLLMCLLPVQWMKSLLLSVGLKVISQSFGLFNIQQSGAMKHLLWHSFISHTNSVDPFSQQRDNERSLFGSTGNTCRCEPMSAVCCLWSIS